jgi:protein TonB
MFLEIGLIAALAFVLTSFEWNSSTKEVASISDGRISLIDDETVPITQQETPPPPESIKEPVISEDLQIVENDVKIDTEFLSPDDNTDPIKIVPYVEPSNKEEEEEIEEFIPFSIVEDKPTFQGGDANTFTKWVYGNIVYPELAIENGIQGRVTVQFTIDKDGSVKDVKVLRGADSTLDKEAVRVISNSPKWTPGKQRGKAVKVKYTFPIIFQMR